MSSSLCHWANTLRWFRLHTVWFEGGEVALEDDEDGITHIGLDVLAVVRRDRQYWIPFEALREVRGTCQTSPNERRGIMMLRSVVSRWVDDGADDGVDEEPPLAEPDVAEFFWHAVIMRSGQEIPGIVVGVSATDVQLRTTDRGIISIPWTRVGAMVEVLE